MIRSEKEGDVLFSPVESILASIWCEVLGRENLGGNENFFDVGGHSLLAMQVTSDLVGYSQLIHNERFACEYQPNVTSQGTNCTIFPFLAGGILETTIHSHEETHVRIGAYSACYCRRDRAKANG